MKLETKQMVIDRAITVYLPFGPRAERGDLHHKDNAIEIRVSHYKGDKSYILRAGLVQLHTNGLKSCRFNIGGPNWGIKVMAPAVKYSEKLLCEMYESVQLTPVQGFTFVEVLKAAFTENGWTLQDLDAKGIELAKRLGLTN